MKAKLVITESGTPRLLLTPETNEERMWLIADDGRVGALQPAREGWERGRLTDVAYAFPGMDEGESGG